MGMAKNQSGGRIWAVILAGGEGERVGPLVRRWLGRHRPKQYCSFVGTRSMFQYTVDRAVRLAAPGETVIVAARGHEAEVHSQLAGRSVGKVLLQPANRDTAAGIFLPLTYVRAADPQATVVVYPSDHFIFPEERFLVRVLRAVRVAEWLDDRIILLGVKPDRLEFEYGWMQPGPLLMEELPGHEVRAVQSFVEKPGAQQADELMRAGSFWNTLVFAAKVECLWRLGRQCFPDMMARFERLQAAIGRPEESAVLEEIYEGMPARNFSSGLLQRIPESAAILEVPGVLWSDWGKPERIAETLRRINRAPAFPLDCLDHPFAPRPLVHGEVRAGEDRGTAAGGLWT
jgi:mannose-1-phosphate guanylyltransferase